MPRLDQEHGSPLPESAVGVGLRPPHFSEALGDSQGADAFPVDFVEVIVENYLGTGPIPQRTLERAAARVPVALHGVSLNLLGLDTLDHQHIKAVDALAQRIGAPCFSDHLCWTSHQGWHSHDLLPTPYTGDHYQRAIERASEVASMLSVPFGIENLSSYATFKGSTMTEWEFYTGVIREAGIWAMLDINNIWVSARNHGFDAVQYLEAVDWDRVLYVHVAGHSVRSDGLVIDTHDGPVCDEVWSLWRKARTLAGPFATLLEWDEKLPTWNALVAEAHKAKEGIHAVL